MSPLTIYFSLHHRNDASPLLCEKFQTNFKMCDVFIMENACQWQLKRLELQEQYNRLSNGASVVPTKPNGDPYSIEARLPLSKFEKQLQDIIHCSERSIILERSPVPYVKVEDFPIRLQNALKIGVKDAVQLCKSQQQQLAASMIQRDDALINLISEQLSGNVKVFVFRGASHEEYLSRRLRATNIRFTTERFCPRVLEERVTVPLTIGQQLDETDVLKWVYVQVNRQNDDFEQLRLLMTKADTMGKEQLEIELAALSNR